MSENSPYQVKVKYQNIDVTLKFSTILRTETSEKALETFVTELLSALRAIYLLWQIWTNQGENPAVLELLYQVTQSIRAYYCVTEKFMADCIRLKRKRVKCPDLMMNEGEGAIGFEKELGPLLDKLGKPIMLLVAYVELIHMSLAPQSFKEQQELISRVSIATDRIVDHILAFHVPYLKEPIAEEAAISAVPFLEEKVIDGAEHLPNAVEVEAIFMK